MKVSKEDLSLRAEPSNRELSLSAEPRNEKMDPEELLQSLKSKHRLFSQLRNEGLIHENRHLNMEKELQATIAELERWLG